MPPPLPPVKLGLAALAIAIVCIAAPACANEAELDRLLTAGDHAQALSHLDALLAERPRDPQLRLRKGVLLADMDRRNDAMALFTALASDYPEIPEVHNNIAVLHAAEGRYELARAALDAAVRANPDYAVAHQNLGDVYAQLARQSYARALQLDPSNTALPSKLALLRDVAKLAPARTLP